MPTRLSPDGRPYIFLRKPEKDLSGKTFSRLTVLGPVALSSDKRVVYMCRCDCGSYTDVIGKQLLGGKTRSCGCLQRESVTKKNFKHGHTGTRTYDIWQGVLRRCRATSGRLFKYYGARGIGVCERWLSFENFLADMGECPEGLSLERRDNDGGYCPENCYWATRLQQANNRRNNHKVMYEGESITIAELARRTGAVYSTLQARLLQGESVERALRRCG